MNGEQLFLGGGGSGGDEGTGREEKGVCEREIEEEDF